jgi:DNA-binding MarR family transcriptional regulator
MAQSREQHRLLAADQLHSAAIHLLRHARKQDAMSGQGPARLSALSVLVFAGPMTLGQLAAAEQVRPPTMSRMVAGLCRLRLAKIAPDANDARRVQISATAKGERLLQRARQRRIQAVAKALGNISEREIAVLQEAVAIMEAAVAGSR